jgi:DNA-binding NarL/FixJ family response regulator
MDFPSAMCLGEGEPIVDSIASPSLLRALAIVDALNLRRVSVASLLQQWATSVGLNVVALSTREVCDDPDAAADYGMVIFNLGGSSILQRENLHDLKVLRALVPNTPLVLLRDHIRSEEVAAALSVGVQGFVHSDITAELAMQAFSFILSGGAYFPPSAMRATQTDEPDADEPIGDQRGRSPSGRPGRLGHAGLSHNRASNLTGRQRDVLERLCHGEPNKLIARRLGMTEGTVKVHVRQIMRKLGAANRTQLAIRASGEHIGGRIGSGYHEIDRCQETSCSVFVPT